MAKRRGSTKGIMDFLNAQAYRVSEEVRQKAADKKKKARGEGGKTKK